MNRKKQGQIGNAYQEVRSDSGRVDRGKFDPDVMQEDTFKLRVISRNGLRYSLPGPMVLFYYERKFPQEFRQSVLMPYFHKVLEVIFCEPFRRFVI